MPSTLSRPKWNFSLIYIDGLVRQQHIASALKRSEGATRQKAFSIGLSRVTSPSSNSGTLPTSPTNVRGAFYSRATGCTEGVNIRVLRPGRFGIGGIARIDEYGHPIGSASRGTTLPSWTAARAQRASSRLLRLRAPVSRQFDR